MNEPGTRKFRLNLPLFLVTAAASAAVTFVVIYAGSGADLNAEYDDGISAADATLEQPILAASTAESPQPGADVAPAAPLPQVPPSAAENAVPQELPAKLPDSPDKTTDPSQVVDVPILVYHSVMPHHPEQTKMQVRYDVAPEIFDRQMQYLRDNGFNVVSMEKFASDLSEGVKPPGKSVVINFDDGYRNQYTYALPILQKYGFTATFFVFTHGLGLTTHMTWDEVKDLARKGMTIGDHSATHPLLYDIKDADKLDQEVGASKQELEKAIGRSVDLFAYPFGKPSPEAEAAVRRAGYSAARIFQGGLLNSKKDLFVLRSVIVTDNFTDFENLLVGTWNVK